MVIVYLFSTENGSRWIVRSFLLTESGRMSIEKIKGTLCERIELIGTKYQDPNTRISIDRFSLSWQPSALLQGIVVVKSINANGVDFSLDQDPPGSENETRIEPSLEYDFPVKLIVEKLSIENIRLAIGDRVHDVQKIQLAALYDLDKVRIDSLSLKAQPLSARIHGQLFLDSDLPFALEIDWNMTPLDQPHWKGSSRASGNLKSLSFTNNVSAPIELGQQGTVDRNDDGLQFSSSGHWNDLHWPLSHPKPTLRSEHGHFSVNGSFDDYRVEIRSQLLIETIPAAALSFQGRGNQNTIAINKLDLLSENGGLHITGMVSWDKNPSFSLTSSARHFNPGVFIRELPGRLTLDSHVTGRWLDEKLEGKVNIKRLKGRLRGYPLSVSGQLAISDQFVSSNNLRIVSNNNSIFLNGTAGKSAANIDFSVDAPSLKALSPTLSGELTGKGHFEGEYGNSSFTFDANGRNLQFAEYRANTLSLNANYRSDRSRNSHAHLAASGIEINGNRIDSVNLKGQGSLMDHQWDAALKSPYAAISTHLKGSATGNAWDGRIDRLELDANEWGNWNLKNPARLAFTKEKNELVIKIEKSCLMHEAGTLCIQLENPKNGDLKVNAKAHSIPLTLAKQKLPKNVDVNGTLNAEGWLRRAKEGFTGAFEIGLPGGTTLSIKKGGEHKQLSIGDSILVGRYVDDTIASQFKLALPDGAGLRGNLLIASGKPRPLSGQMRAELNELSLFEPFLPDFAPFHGTLNANVAVSGNIDQPIAQGEILLEGGAADLRRLGIELREIRLQALTQDHDPMRVILSGRARSGAGKLDLNGSLKLDPGGGWPVDMNLAGTDFEVARLPEARIWVSPDLALVSSNSGKKITGTIAIPKAKLTLSEIPQDAIAPSPDQVIIGEKNDGPSKHQPPPSDANLSVRLGKDVRFSGKGLTTKLAGKVDVKKTGAKTQVYGNINFTNARYRAYGQDLNVRRGELLFNGPMDNPWLDIEAIRLSNSKKVTAILRVTGPMKSPQTTISSIPPLPESEALAYLVTGRALSRASQSEANMIAGAALAYGVGHFPWLTEQLGIDEFEIQEGETFQDTLVSVGKYITRDFYVGTSVGLFNRIPNPILKYRLSDELSVETYSGESQGIELKYEFDVE